MIAIITYLYAVCRPLPFTGRENLEPKVGVKEKKCFLFTR